MKKLKLISSLSLLTAVTTAVPLVSTACKQTKDINSPEIVDAEGGTNRTYYETLSHEHVTPFSFKLNFVEGPDVFDVVWYITGVPSGIQYDNPIAGWFSFILKDGCTQPDKFLFTLSAVYKNKTYQCPITVIKSL